MNVVSQVLIDKHYNKELALEALIYYKEDQAA